MTRNIREEANDTYGEVPFGRVLGHSTAFQELRGLFFEAAATG
jgi:hypothetical protein